MKKYLPLFTKPSHYLGNEVNSIHKDLKAIKVHIGLAFPDLYEVGMSYYGQRILYHLLNQKEEYYAERVYAPSLEVAKILREKKAPLATLESDTPLVNLDILGFSLTNELAYTTCLYMLDLAGIPFRAKDRKQDFPLIVAGGGVTFNAEPAAPFFDVMFLGDGEGLLLDFLDAFALAKENKVSKQDFLLSLKGKKGIYIPDFFEVKDKNGKYYFNFKYPEYKQVKKYVYPDLNEVTLNSKEIIPYGKPVHDRLTVEVARGCTRGCRFCHAGFVYRPVRERKLSQIKNYLTEGLVNTGYEELSFLSLSTGDFSLLEELFREVMEDLCKQKTAISLPSLRVGTVSEKLLKALSKIRKTGITIAPEAGSERLRRVINKNLREEEILDYAQQIFKLGWKQIKLYFMLGLPTETKEDLQAIYDLCSKILSQAPDNKVRLTASVSLFVPKAHTPFQWARQLNLEELEERISFLRSLFKRNKRLTLKYHNPQMSLLEGVFSRGGRELAQVLEEAYRRGEILSNWDDFLHFENWLKAFQACNLDWQSYLRARDLEEVLPWDHLDCGVKKEFLEKEYAKALKEKVTEDCRFGKCSNCGVCDFKNKQIIPKINKPVQDISSKEVELKDISLPKKYQVKLWFSKTGLAAYLSQLELQKVLERALRRGQIPLAFSQGFHPVPLISFGRALPVGLESLEEIIHLFLTEPVEPCLWEKINNCLPSGIKIYGWELIDLKEKIVLSKREDFKIFYELGREGKLIQQIDRFRKSKNWEFLKKGKKKVRTVNLKKIVFFRDIKSGEIEVGFNWEEVYLNPLLILKDILGEDITGYRILKVKQYLE